MMLHLLIISLFISLLLCAHPRLIISGKAKRNGQIESNKESNGLAVEKSNNCRTKTKDVNDEEEKEDFISFGDHKGIYHKLFVQIHINRI